MTSDEERGEAAIRWLIEMDGTVFSEEQLVALRNWLRDSDENCDAYLRVLRGMRRTLLLRRNDLPVMVGTRGPQVSAASGEAEDAFPKMPANWEIPADEVNGRLGKAIRRLRQAKGWTQRTLAREAKLSDRYVSQLETGARGLTVEVFMRITMALGVPASVVLQEMEEQGG